MAGDGRVVIDTELNTKPAEKQAQGLGNSLKGGLVKGTKAAAVGLAAMGAAAVAAAWIIQLQQGTISEYHYP